VPTDELDWEVEWAIDGLLAADNRSVYDALSFLKLSTTHASWKEKLKASMEVSKRETRVK
jgi:hypothetical protein